MREDIPTRVHPPEGGDDSSWFLLARPDQIHARALSTNEITGLLFR